MLLGAVPIHHSSVTDARVAAADVLADLRDGLLLDAAFDRRTSNLDARDRRWTQELVYGLLRRREDLDSALHPRVRGGIARLHAIGASKLANAVLRRVDREREQLATEGKSADDEVGQLARKYSHPRWLVERWVSRFGSRDTERLLQR